MRTPGCSTTRAPISAWLIVTLAPIRQSSPISTPAPITAVGADPAAPAEPGAGLDDGIAGRSRNPRARPPWDRSAPTGARPRAGRPAPGKTPAPPGHRPCRARGSPAAPCPGGARSAARSSTKAAPARDCRNASRYLRFSRKLTSSGPGGFERRDIASTACSPCSGRQQLGAAQPGQLGERERPGASEKARVRHRSRSRAGPPTASSPCPALVGAGQARLRRRLAAAAGDRRDKIDRQHRHLFVELLHAPRRSRRTTWSNSTRSVRWNTKFAFRCLAMSAMIFSIACWILESASLLDFSSAWRLLCTLRSRSLTFCWNSRPFLFRASGDSDACCRCRTVAFGAQRPPPRAKSPWCIRRASARSGRAPSWPLSNSAAATERRPPAPSDSALTAVAPAAAEVPRRARGRRAPAGGAWATASPAMPAQQ